jgi:hypothetical protein
MAAEYSKGSNYISSAKYTNLPQTLDPEKTLTSSGLQVELFPLFPQAAHGIYHPSHHHDCY